MEVSVIEGSATGGGPRRRRLCLSSCGRRLSDRFAAADPLRRQRFGLGRVVSERQPDRVECDIYTGVFVNHAAIYTMKADGSGLRSLTPKGLNGEPSWSPGGKLIVFSTSSSESRQRPW